MDKEKIYETAKNVKDKSNKELAECRDELMVEFNKTKELIVELTRHFESVETYYNIINDEIGKRII